MSSGSNTDSYPAFTHNGLRENHGKNLDQVTCPDRESNPGHLVSRLDALTVTPQDGARSHLGVGVRNFLNQIGRRGTTEWPPRSCDLPPCDFSLWGILKKIMFLFRSRRICINMADVSAYRLHLSAGAAHIQQSRRGINNRTAGDLRSVAPLHRWRLGESWNRRRYDVLVEDAADSGTWTANRCHRSEEAAE
ncbi:hypothetical protein ANN_24034 [Periplaneta americana]|uniref:Uncharacterized protein n=1 Tax=Periplaneta americana TaxID=6978 RepID=A0ABQ8S274_PERAM|nr:hypothetical protein ANN_24034 [Periplaneta americana]